MRPEQRCASCRKKMPLGVDVIGVRHGVLGHRRFVPLEEDILLCSDACVRSFFNGAPQQEERIP